MICSAGETVFFQHPTHSWVLGTVASVASDRATVTAADPKRGVTGDTTAKLTPDQVVLVSQGFVDEVEEDLLRLTILHDATLLRCLFLRYMDDHIYTNIGAIVVAINPFNYKIPWYKDDKMPAYLEEGPIIERNLPHSWAQAHNTYNELRADCANQCILISGESGAGKTEATKIVMRYLSKVSALSQGAEERAAAETVLTNLVACSPVLESFGNARTVRNDNSSRFGKLMRIKFNGSGVLTGADITKYLLEKSRIVTAAKGERVYHAFYYLTKGPLGAEMQLQKASDYRATNAGKCIAVDGIDDSAPEVAEELAALTDRVGS